MFRIFPDKINAILLAIAVHVIFVMVLLVNMDWSKRPAPARPTPSSPKVESIQAMVVDEARVRTELTRIEEQERKSRQSEETRLRKIEQKIKAAERRRKEEERKLAAARKKFKQEQERQRKKAKEVARKKKEEARQRKAREAAAKKEAARKKKEEERKRKEAERALQKKLAAEQTKRESRQRQRLRDQYRQEYITDIKSEVERNWVRTIGSAKGLKCKLKVTQIPTGEVVNVAVIASSGNTAFDRSAVAAVFKSSPLPRPKDSSIFDRNIVLTFSPEN
uniref:Colicin import membrane protein n=1 Tax=Candidatus Kentrum sp. MB TaxID=2138164 RepID=A0A450X2V7_9GAMM|nr:MAG: colicin import membrane protein [Candidatus Kentron sp. MB]VFK27943.1 MAG: colicin import membrane protein [Candidatus Kentron sp. MB]VFK74472.1 MAG: colicin import membrane protein [Candidatus Kentron sp. MB]